MNWNKRNRPEWSIALGAILYVFLVGWVGHTPLHDAVSTAILLAIVSTSYFTVRTHNAVMRIEEKLKEPEKN